MQILVHILNDTIVGKVENARQKLAKFYLSNFKSLNIWSSSLNPKIVSFDKWYRPLEWTRMNEDIHAEEVHYTDYTQLFKVKKHAEFLTYQIL